MNNTFMPIKMKNTVFIIVIILFLPGCSLHEQVKPEKSKEKVVRKGAVIKLKPEKVEFYKELHAHPWKAVNDKLKECHIQNYTIFYRDGYLFSYLEYTGDNWEQDMKKLAADSVIQAWWKLTDPCQEPVPFAKDGEWWADLEEIYHLQ